MTDQDSQPVGMTSFRGAKLALRPMHVWALRVRLQLARRARDMALFDLAIDSKLRSCDVVALRLGDILVGASVRSCAIVIQRKTGRPVQFEITQHTRRSVSEWLTIRRAATDWIFPSRMDLRRHLSTRQYARLVKQWIELLGLDGSSYATHSLRRTKVALLYRKTGNLRACQLLLGHTKLESKVRILALNSMTP